ncbi:MAG TPA: IS4/IS5 family transposase, partial [Verrucomicrobiae bacterium]
ADPSPLTLWVLEARELRPHQGVSLGPWQLLTTLPVTTLAAACERIGWHVLRSQIQVLHKVLKSGCQIEQRQLETAVRLERVLAVARCGAAAVVGTAQRGGGTPPTRRSAPG